MAPSGSKDVTEKKAGQARQSCLGKVIIVAFEFQSVRRPASPFSRTVFLPYLSHLNEGGSGSGAASGLLGVEAVKLEERA